VFLVLGSSCSSSRPSLDIVGWLDSWGMKKYVELFVREEIDMSVLPFVTEHHLERIGITSLGSRLQLVNAILMLKQEVQAGEVFLFLLLLFDLLLLLFFLLSFVPSRIEVVY
jgi:hypothetical protein